MCNTLFKKKILVAIISTVTSIQEKEVYYFSEQLIAVIIALPALYYI